MTDTAAMPNCLAKDMFQDLRTAARGPQRRRRPRNDHRRRR
jgi:hypothetical protein